MNKILVKTSLGRAFVDSRTDSLDVMSKAAEQAALREHYKPAKPPKRGWVLSNQSGYGADSATYNCTIAEKLRSGGSSPVGSHSVVVYSPKNND